MAWMVYEKNEVYNKPVISIRSGGRMGFNDSARKYFGENRFVILNIDVEGRKIGVKPVSSKSEPGARPVRLAKYDAFVLAEDFLKDYGLFDHKGKLVTTWSKELEMLVADFPAITEENIL